MPAAKSTTKPKAAPAPVDERPRSKVHRIAVTCRYCGKPSERLTRAGRHFTCPHCRKIQEGPGAITEKLDTEEQRIANGHTPPKTRSRGRPRNSEPRPAPPIAAAAASDPDSRPSAPVDSKPPAPPPPARQRGLFGRLLSGEWEG